MLRKAINRFRLLVFMKFELIIFESLLVLLLIGTIGYVLEHNTSFAGGSNNYYIYDGVR